MTQEDRLKKSCIWRRFNQATVRLGVEMKLNGVPEDHPARVYLRHVLRGINQEQARLGDMEPERVAGVLTRGERPMNHAT